MVETNALQPLTDKPHDHLPGNAHRRWATLDLPRSKGGRLVTAPFRFLCYNILSEPLRLKNAYLYKNVKEEVARWENRLGLICQEILHYAPQVVCLQEVENFEDVHSRLSSQYDGYYVQRTGQDKTDGCAMLWQRSSLRCVAKEEIRMSQHALNDNVAQVAVLRHERPADAHRTHVLDLVVGNIHVLFNPRRGDTKLGQARTLLEAVDKAVFMARSRVAGGMRPPCLAAIMGDFNSSADSPLYRYVTEGQLDVAGVRRADVSGLKTRDSCGEVDRSGWRSHGPSPSVRPRYPWSDNRSSDRSGVPWNAYGGRPGVQPSHGSYPGTGGPGYPGPGYSGPGLRGGGPGYPMSGYQGHGSPMGGYQGAQHYPGPPGRWPAPGWRAARQPTPRREEPNWRDGGGPRGAWRPRSDPRGGDGFRGPDAGPGGRRGGPAAPDVSRAPRAPGAGAGPRPAWNSPAGRGAAQVPEAGRPGREGAPRAGEAGGPGAPAPVGAPPHGPGDRADGAAAAGQANGLSQQWQQSAPKRPAAVAGMREGGGPGEAMRRVTAGPVQVGDWEEEHLRSAFGPRAEPGSTVLRHPLKLRSAHAAVRAREPAYTTANSGTMDTVDFLFYTPSGWMDDGCAEMHVAGVLEEPDMRLVAAGLPTAILPSDHVSLVADLVARWTDQSRAPGNCVEERLPVHL